MSLSAPLRINPHAPQNKRSPFCQTMRVMSDANPKHMSGVWSLESGVWKPKDRLLSFDSRLQTPDSRLFQKYFRERDVLWPSNLDVARVAFDGCDRHAESFDERAVVGRVRDKIRRLFEGSAQQLVAKTLRRESASEARALKGSHDPIVLHFLDCIYNRCGKNCCAALLSRAHRALYLVGGNERAHAVVHGHDFGGHGAHGRKPAPN